MSWNIWFWVLRCEKWILRWASEKATTPRRRVPRRSQFRVLSCEQLGARVMLTTYYWDPPQGSDMDWFSVDKNWSTSQNSYTAADYVNGAGNSAVISESAATNITVNGNVIAGSIAFQSSGAYTLAFPAGISSISGGTMALQSGRA